jgi:hypothetical protein
MEMDSFPSLGDLVCGFDIHNGVLVTPGPLLPVVRAIYQKASNKSPIQEDVLVIGRYSC